MPQRPDLAGKPWRLAGEYSISHHQIQVKNQGVPVYMRKVCVDFLANLWYIYIHILNDRGMQFNTLLKHAKTLFFIPFTVNPILPPTNIDPAMIWGSEESFPLKLGYFQV
jgi:hypothetical protein